MQNSTQKKTPEPRRSLTRSFMQRLTRSRTKACLLLMMLLALTGCGKRKENPLVVKEKEQYERVTHSEAEVRRGDFPNTIILSLSMEDLITKEYMFSETAMSNYATKLSPEMSAYVVPVAKVYVKVGDHVNAGDTLVEAAIPEADKELQEEEKNADRLSLNLEHLRNLAELDPSQDYTGEIKDTEQQLQLARTKLSEMREQKKGVSLVAEEEGTVTYINEYLEDYGYFDSYNPMVRITSGTGKYTVSTEDDYPFRVGQVFHATANENTYDFELTEIMDEGNGSRRLQFTPVSDVSGLADSQRLDLMVEKEPYRDVVYVNRKAVTKTNGRSWVYVMDENGYLEAREVECGDIIDDAQIILSGLSGGETVSVE